METGAQLQRRLCLLWGPAPMELRRRLLDHLLRPSLDFRVLRLGLAATMTLWGLALRDALAPLGSAADLVFHFLGAPRLRRKNQKWRRLIARARARLLAGAAVVATGPCKPCPCSFGPCWCNGRCPCARHDPAAARRLEPFLKANRHYWELTPAAPDLLVLPAPIAAGPRLGTKDAYRLIARHAPCPHDRSRAWTLLAQDAATAAERTRRLLLRRLVTAESVLCRHRALAAAGVPPSLRAAAIQTGLLRSRAYWDLRLPALVAAYEAHFPRLDELSHQPQRFPRARHVDRTWRARSARRKRALRALGF
jgi:hypothetical protein